MFLLRLCSFQITFIKTGFISDVSTLLHNHDLYYHLQDYVTYGTFPSKFIWKKWLITTVYINEWIRELPLNNLYCIGKYKRHSLSSPVWSFARHNPGMLRACFSVAQLIEYMSSTESTCSKCGNVDICTNLTYVDQLYYGSDLQELVWTNCRKTFWLYVTCYVHWTAMNIWGICLV